MYDNETVIALTKWLGADPDFQQRNEWCIVSLFSALADYRCSSGSNSGYSVVCKKQSLFGKNFVVQAVYTIIWKFSVNTVLC